MARILFLGGLLASLALAVAIGFCTDRGEEGIVSAAQKSEDSDQAFDLTTWLSCDFGRSHIAAPPAISAAARPGDLMIFRWWIFRLPLTRQTWTCWDHRLIRDEETIVHVRTGTGPMLLRGGLVAGAPLILGIVGAVMAALAQGRRNQV